MDFVNVVTLSDLVIYPLKSAGGIRVAEAAVDRWGPLHDRRFLVVDPDGVFLTQRQLPRMALITPELRDETLLLNAPGMGGLELPLSGSGAPTQPVQVWDDRA